MPYPEDKKQFVHLLLLNPCSCELATFPRCDSRCFRIELQTFPRPLSSYTGNCTTESCTDSKNVVSQQACPCDPAFSTLPFPSMWYLHCRYHMLAGNGQCTFHLFTSMRRRLACKKAVLETTGGEHLSKKTLVWEFTLRSRVLLFLKNVAFTSEIRLSLIWPGTSRFRTLHTPFSKKKTSKKRENAAPHNPLFIIK